MYTFFELKLYIKIQHTDSYTVSYVHGESGTAETPQYGNAETPQS